MHPFLREMEKLLDQEHEILVRETEIMQKAPLDELIKKGDCIPNIRLERRESFSHHFSFEDKMAQQTSEQGKPYAIHFLSGIAH